MMTMIQPDLFSDAPLWRKPGVPPWYHLHCHDCGRYAGIDSGHYYTAHDDIWAAAGCDRRTILCLDCFEARLDRRLSQADFLLLPQEILARRRTPPGDPMPALAPPAERARQLVSWREFILERPDLFET